MPLKAYDWEVQTVQTAAPKVLRQPWPSQGRGRAEGVGEPQAGKAYCALAAALHESAGEEA